MPAEFESGMFYRTPAWHNEGNVIDEEVDNWDDAAKYGDVLWEPETAPVAVQVKMPLGVMTMPAKEYVGVVRSDTQALLCVQQSTRAVIGNAELGSIIDYVVQNVPKVRYEALVVLRGGRMVTATLNLGEPIQIPGDRSETRPQLVVSARHDGRGGLKLGPSAYRVVCANTQQMAERDIDATGLGFTIRHTKNWAERINDAKLAIEASLASINQFELMARDLADWDLHRGSVEDFLDQWMPYSTDQTEGQRAGVTRRRAKFMEVWERPETMAFLPDTKYKLLQGAIEYCDWEVNHRSSESQVAKQLVLGDPAKVKALSIIGSL